MMYPVSKRQLTLIVLVCLLTISSNRHSSEQSLALQLVAREPNIADLSWTENSRYLQFLDRSTNQAYAYDLKFKTLLQGSIPEDASHRALTNEEIQFFHARPLPSYISLNNRYVVYAGNEIDSTKSYRIFLGDRQQRKLVDTRLVVADPAQVTPESGDAYFYTVEWNRTDNAFMLFQGGSNSNALDGLINNFTSDVNQFKLWTPKDFGIAGLDNILYEQIYHISDNGNSILIRTGAKDDYSSLLIINLLDTRQNKSIQPLQDTLIKAATFVAGSATKLFIVSEAGLVRYDLNTNSLVILNAQITSAWLQEAVFSPDGHWLSVSHLEEDGQVSIYVVDMTSLTAPSSPTLLPPFTFKQQN